MANYPHPRTYLLYHLLDSAGASSKLGFLTFLAVSHNILDDCSIHLICV
jgi:hypothetical protein